MLLILSQYPTATRVAGFRKWQTLGRQVRRGEKSIRIFGYRTIKTDDTTPSTAAGEGQGEAGERVRVRAVYPMLSVFDIAQTDLIDPAAGDPAALAQQLEGEDPAGIAAAVTDYLTAAGWTVTRETLPGRANGYTTTDGTRRVVIDADLLPAQTAKTALHEAAHVLLHADEEPGEYAAHRGIKETEAESVAYVLAGLLGLDTAAYSIGYVAGWAGRPRHHPGHCRPGAVRRAHPRRRPHRRPGERLKRRNQDHANQADGDLPDAKLCRLRAGASSSCLPTRPRRSLRARPRRRACPICLGRSANSSFPARIPPAGPRPSAAPRRTKRNSRRSTLGRQTGPMLRESACHCEGDSALEVTMRQGLQLTRELLGVGHGATAVSALLTLRLRRF